MDIEKQKQNISRKKIINSAIMLFANKGFDSTSTREICKHAGVNLSLIPYYFGNKDGLYINIIESIVNYGIATFHMDIERVKDISEMKISEKIELYKSLLTKYANFVYSSNVPNSFVALMIKEQMVSHSKFSKVYSTKINILYSALRKILASIMDKKEDDKSIVFDVASIIGQILGLKLMDRATLEALHQDLYTQNDCKKLINTVLSYIESEIIRVKQIVNKK